MRLRWWNGTRLGTITVDVNGPDDEDEYAGGEIRDGGGAWNTFMLTKTDAATEAEDTVVLYTDIEAPSDKLLTAQYTQDELDDALNTARVEKAMSSGFPSGTGTTWVFTGADGERAKTVTGTFDGVPGQFTCTDATSCTVSTNNEGVLMPSTDWRFTPAAPLTATVKDPDTTHSWFGWWLNKPEDQDTVHDVDVFAGSNGTEDDVDATVVGRASYSGPAAGKYATKTFSAGVQKDAGVGHFTATANLVANFGDDSDTGGVSGSVTGFTLDDTTTVGWKVTLEGTDDNNNISGANFTGTTEVDFGGGPTDDDVGAWQGTFYDAGDEASDKPGTAVGTFDAETGNASVIGAFGAKKQ